MRSKFQAFFNVEKHLENRPHFYEIIGHAFENARQHWGGHKIAKGALDKPQVIPKEANANSKLPVFGSSDGYVAKQVNVGVKAGENYKSIISRVSGEVQGEYSVINPGSLTDSIAETFSGGRYATIKLDEDLKVFRVWTPGQSNEFGAFWTLDKPSGSYNLELIRPYYLNGEE